MAPRVTTKDVTAAIAAGMLPRRAVNQSISPSITITNSSHARSEASDAAQTVGATQNSNFGALDAPHRLRHALLPLTELTHD